MTIEKAFKVLEKKMVLWKKIPQEFSLQNYPD